MIGVVIGILLASTAVVIAGNLDPSAPPESTNFYSLQDLYNRLDTGAAGTARTFTEPSSGPGSTMPTVNEIMAAAPATRTHAATQTHILSGTVAWGLSESAWGVITGTGTMGAGVPKTGQTISYTVGDDGDLQQGVAWPNPRFTDNGDGTVTDNLTGLIWLQDANCPNGQKTWSAAITFANSLYDGWTGDGSGGDCGLSDGSSAGDWRLPNVRELQSLIHWGYNPALPNTAGTGQWTEGNPFTGVQSNVYWSSTTVASDASDAWAVNLNGGYVGSGNKPGDNYVWPVRGGQ